MNDFEAKKLRTEVVRAVAEIRALKAEIIAILEAQRPKPQEPRRGQRT